MIKDFLKREIPELICPKCHNPAVIDEPDLWCPHCHYSEPLRDYPEAEYRDGPDYNPEYYRGSGYVFSEKTRPEPQPSRDDFHHIQVELNTLMNRLNTHLDMSKKAQKDRL